MKPRFIRLLAGLSALAALAFALRHDLGELALRQGDQWLRAGDIEGAAAALRQTLTLDGRAAPLAYNLGVALYRRGEYARADQHFTRALATADPELAAAIHFNRGNSRFRQAEALVPHAPPGAARLLREAVADYGAALVLAPADDAARHNLEQARSRLRAVTAAMDQQRRAEKPPQSRPGSPPDASRQSRKPAGASQAARTPGRDDAPEEEPLTSGKNRRDLSPAQVERLLNEARGRERPFGPPRGDAKTGPVARPDKDW